MNMLKATLFQVLSSTTALYCLTAVTSLASEFPQIESVTAKAYDSSGNLLYTEESTQTLKNGQVANIKSEYFNTEGKKIADLTSEFKSDSYLADYQYADHRIESLSGISLQDGEKSAELFIKKDKSKKDADRKKMQLKGEMLSIPGVENFVRNFVENKLKNNSKEKASVRFVIPDRLDDVGFRLYAESEKDSVVHLKLEPESFFIRMFAPSITIDYDKNIKHIISYKGPSHVFDDNGKCQKVSLAFQYKKSTQTEVAKNP